MAFYRWERDNLLLFIHVQPRAKQTVVVEIQEDKLKVKMSAPPVDGRANAGLCAFFAELFGVAKSQVTVIKGQKSRDKCLCIKSPKLFPDFIENQHK